MQCERQYLRDLQMLLKVFREQLADKLEKENEVRLPNCSHLKYENW